MLEALKNNKRKLDTDKIKKFTERLIDAENFTKVIIAIFREISPKAGKTGKSSREKNVSKAGKASQSKKSKQESELI